MARLESDKRSDLGGPDQGRKELQAGLLMSGAQFGRHFFRLIRSFIVPTILGPEKYGLWKILGLFQKYGNMAHLGVFHSFTREIPIALGKKDDLRVRSVRDLSFTVVSLLGIALVVIPSALLLVGVDLKGAIENHFIAVLLGLWTALTLCSAAQERFALACSEFTLLSKVRVISAFMESAVAIAMVYFWGIPGLLGAGVLAFVVANAIYWKLHRKVDIRPRFDIAGLWELLKIGVPIFLTSLASGIYWSLDSLVIAAMMAPRQLGQYSFALIAFPLIQILPDQFASVFAQRMARQIGKLGKENPSHMGVFFRESQVFLLCLSSMAVAGAGLTFPVVVKNYFPAYEPAIVIAHILMCGFLFYRLRSLASYFLILIDRQGQFLVIQLVSIALNVAGDIVVISMGYGLKEVAIVCAVGYVLFGTMVILVVFPQIYGSYRQAFWLLFRSTLVFVGLYLLFRMDLPFAGGWQGLLQSFIAGLLLAAGVGAYFWLVFPGVRKPLKDALGKFPWSKKL